jgi:hypothetical protein
LIDLKDSQRIFLKKTSIITTSWVTQETNGRCFAPAGAQGREKHSVGGEPNRLVLQGRKRKIVHFRDLLHR